MYEYKVSINFFFFNRGTICRKGMPGGMQVKKGLCDYFINYFCKLSIKTILYTKTTVF